jgi:hypothetical protein
LGVFIGNIIDQKREKGKGEEVKKNEALRMKNEAAAAQP